MATEGEVTQASSREGSFGRVVGVLVSPRATFESIARKPGWFLPVLLIVLVNLLVAFSVMHRGILRAAMEKQMESSPLSAQMTSQQRDQAAGMAMRLAPIERYVGAIVGTPVVLLIVAAVFLGAFNALFGADIRFAQSFAVSAFASVPSLLRGFASLALVWTRAPANVDLRSLSMSSLAAYLPASPPAWLVTLGAHLDVFTFWTLGLLAIGYAATSSKKARFGGALAVVLTIWVIYVLASVGLVVGAGALVPRP